MEYTNEEKDVVIAKLQYQLDCLKASVMTDDGIYTFPDGEFICGCGIRQGRNNIADLQQKITKLQSDLDESKQKCTSIHNNWQKAYEQLISEQPTRKHRA